MPKVALDKNIFEDLHELNRDVDKLIERFEYLLKTVDFPDDSLKQLVHKCSIASQITQGGIVFLLDALGRVDDE